MSTSTVQRRPSDTQDVDRRPSGTRSTAAALSDVVRAEWSRIARPRTLAATCAGAAAFAVLVTTILMLNLGGDPRLSVALTTAGGGLAPVGMGLSFASIPVFAVFVAMAAGMWSRGTWRAALLHQPRRGVLAAGQFLARWALTSLVCLLVLGVGWLTALALAPSQGIDTSAWFTAAAAGDILEQVGRMIAFVGGWGLIGTTLGTLTRNTPVSLAVGLLWAGPVENVLADGWEPAFTWFPGLLLRGLLMPAESPLGQDRIAVTLLAYAAALLTLLLLTVRRRDATGG